MTSDRALKQAVREDASSEFDRQAATLVERGYPAAAGLTERPFRARIEPLRAVAMSLDPTGDAERGAFGFAIVVRGSLVPSVTSIALVRRRGKAGFLSMLTAEDLAAFAPIERVELPDGDVYLLAGIESGRSSLNATPDDALTQILAAGRSPLTIDEGIALITQFPEAIAKNGGISLAGSRCGDRRVTALWISQSAPKLGWCWAGNPHTWLGVGSCARRLDGAA